ncbi:PP2C family protein-serine/threonine phosphatase [Streptomyces apricus]|uniref:PP2C family protein-serine/threonine phosphatase n=1 Tax=Streptomyces apricus TaxID=1828112 RepID=UPI001F2C554E|nr:SpoIIE family protein phosphatase [Streptomyces apricus]
MKQAASPSSGTPDDWWRSLHKLWRAALDVQDVTAVASLVYRVLLQRPGTAVVVGARWGEQGLTYVRCARPGQDEPTTWPALSAQWPFGTHHPAVLPGAGGPQVRSHAFARPGDAALAPAGQLLARAHARWAVACLFPLADGDSAGLWVGLDHEPAGAQAQLLGDQLSQIADVLSASNRRILEARLHERRQARDAFLAEASLQMDASLDVAETLHRVARLAVPAVAEGCVVHLFGPGGLPRSVATAHVAATAQSWLAQVAHDDAWLRAQLQRGAEHPEVRTLRDADLAGGPFGPDAAGQGATVRALSITPLRARGRTLGTLTFLYGGDDTGLTDQRMLADLSGRAALAIDTTTLYEQRRRHVQLLQKHLLPRALPAAPGLELSAAYDVGDTSLDVGGDFYDAVAAKDRVVLFIGDVCGRGAEAAAFTGLARHTLRTLLEDGMAPAPALSRLNRALTGEGASRFVTALVVVLTPAADGWDAEIAGAGHPWPLVRRADGRVEQIPAPGMLLGVVPETAYEPTRIRLAAGDSVVMFTDGLTEARSADGTHFEEHLPAAVAQYAARGESPAARLAAAASAFRTSGDDDTAVLIASVKGQP